MEQLRKRVSLWNTLLASALVILAYLVTVHTREALSYSSLATYCRARQASISWAPSRGPVAFYLLEITDTQFLGDEADTNAITTKKEVRTASPSYRMVCEHNHSYQLRVQAISPAGTASAFSEPSVLFICDRQKPVLRLDPLPSPAKVRSEQLVITGTYDEPYLDTLLVNGIRASINPAMRTFSSPVRLAREQNRVLIHATDLAGNGTTETLVVTYAPLTIISSPVGAEIYWNGNYAYHGIFAGTAPQLFKQHHTGKSFLRVTAPGFTDYCSIVDFSDLNRDLYPIMLTPATPLTLTAIHPVTLPPDTTEVTSPTHPFAVDYNLDGVTDLLVGTQDGKIMRYTVNESEGVPQLSVAGFLTTEGKALIDVGTHAAPFMADYDNDGKSDLLVGNGDGSLLYYANQGSLEAPIFASAETIHDVNGMPLSVESFSKPFLVDWDNDRKKDIIMGSGDGTVVCYHNDGSDRSPRFSSPYPLTADDNHLAVESNAAPFVADWDGDGAKDLLVGDGEGYVILYRNTARGTPRLVRERRVVIDDQEVMVEGCASPFVVDWNRDGRYELFLGSRDGALYYLN